MPFGTSHPVILYLANSAVTSFFREIHVTGSENVPEQGPIIFACTHQNMAVDPAVLSSTVPHGHYLHYWVKDSLFKNPAMGALLNNAGNIAVDRKTKNNQKLFKGTFEERNTTMLTEALALNESIGVFPEGTSHTEPHIIPLKDGVSWAALEYVKYLRGTEENGGPKNGKKAVVIPVSLAYVDKSKYRSRVAVHYGPAISMDQYEPEFFSESEGDSKLAVKRLTRQIELEIRKASVNAPDWDTAYAAKMAREILWEEESDLELSNYIDVTQTLVDLFATTGNERISSLKTLLATYHRLLISSRLSNAALTDIPLPQTLDPSRKLSLPNRFFPLWLLVKDSLTALFRLPFFVLPLLINIPVYIVGILGARLAEDEMETQAQMKIACGLLLTLLTYPVLFFTFWAIFRAVPLGSAIAAGAVFLLGRYHAVLVDQNYEGMKRLLAAWRILIGVWTPKRLEMPLPSFVASATQFAPDPPRVAGLPPTAEREKYKRPKRLPSRILVRQVLRTRLEAARELASVLFEMEEKDLDVNASFWLAEDHGGEVLKVSKEDEGKADWERPLQKGVRGGREIVGFLRERGARLGLQKQLEGHWAAATSGDEGVGEGEGEDEEGEAGSG